MPASASELAARLAARLCHDFAGAAGGIQSGLEFLADRASPISREEALAYIQESSRALSAQLAFARVAFGAGEATFAGSELEGIARSLFEPIRPTLNWSVLQPALPGAPARILLNLAQLGGGALATGGEVRVSAGVESGEWRLSVDATGPRPRLYPEVQAGLEGAPCGGGLPGRWVQGAFVHALSASIGGTVLVTSDAEAVRFSAILPF